MLLCLVIFLSTRYWLVNHDHQSPPPPPPARVGTYNEHISSSFSKSTGEIKRREVSWTLMKKLDTFAGPGEIKRREVVLDPQVSPEEIMSREVELCSESWTCLLQVVTQQRCNGHCPCDSAPHSR